jgi:hypothetical protein
VSVILDRRIVEGDPEPDLGGGGDPDRRWQPDVYDELILRGFVIARA